MIPLAIGFWQIMTDETTSLAGSKSSTTFNAPSNKEAAIFFEERAEMAGAIDRRPAANDLSEPKDRGTFASCRVNNERGLTTLFIKFPFIQTVHVAINASHHRRVIVF